MLANCRCTVIRRLKKAPSRPEVSAVHSANIDHHLLKGGRLAGADGVAGTFGGTTVPRTGGLASDTVLLSLAIATVVVPAACRSLCAVVVAALSPGAAGAPTKSMLR